MALKMTVYGRPQSGLSQPQPGGTPRALPSCIIALLVASASLVSARPRAFAAQMCCRMS